jgi:hypothetical protein
MHILVEVMNQDGETETCLVIETDWNRAAEQAEKAWPGYVTISLLNYDK